MPELLARFHAAPDRAAARHADGGQGPRLPGRDARRRARRRRDAALPRLPRRGAHVRADRPARRPRGPRPARRPRARPDHVARRARDRRRRPPRRRRLPERASSSAAAGAALPAVRRPDPGRHQRRRRRGPPAPRPPRIARGDRACRDTELLGPAPLFRLRDRERFQVVSRPPSARAAIARHRRAPSRPPPRDQARSSDVDLLRRRRPDTRHRRADGRRESRPCDEVDRAHGEVAEPQERLDPETRARREAALRARAQVRRPGAARRGRWRSTASTTRCVDEVAPHGRS